ncbi:MAG: hypothetical protein HYW10_00655 [Candidatus Omnitrophica bacterium]|nr:hypothetical protein [Candidatus Omnitrophota bacterium]
MRCPLCGYRFDRGSQGSVCGSCPLWARCLPRPQALEPSWREVGPEGLLSCPQCHYTWVEHSRLVTWIRQRWSARSEHGRSH